jgi:hypothetical protein
MFKTTAILIAAVMAAGGAFAQEFDGGFAQDAPSVALRYQVRADLDTVRAAGAWPVHEYSDAQRYTGAGSASRHAKHRPHKEYPNVMGISMAEWLASQP